MDRPCWRPAKNRVFEVCSYYSLTASNSMSFPHAKNCNDYADNGLLVLLLELECTWTNYFNVSFLVNELLILILNDIEKISFELKEDVIQS